MAALRTSWPAGEPFDPNLEFRAFICSRLVTAISQFSEAEDCGWGRYWNADLCNIADDVRILLDVMLKQQIH